MKNTQSAKTIWISLSFLLGISAFFVPPLLAQDFKKTVITDPAISRRCNALLRKRAQKIDHKQKISSLLERNRRLLQVTPLERKTLRTKLKKTYKQLTRELRHTLNQIQNKEENIIRKGCPGIAL